MYNSNESIRSFTDNENWDRMSMNNDEIYHTVQDLDEIIIPTELSPMVELFFYQDGKLHPV